MSTNAAGFDFTRFIPGFDFLQQAGQAQSVNPAFSQWIAPSLDPEEAGRRIQELKTVLFWLEQNATALKATIQALEVQQLTCQTLQSMNTGVADWAQKMQQAMAASNTVNSSSVENPQSADATPQNTTANPAASATEEPAAAEAALQSTLEQAKQWWGSLLQTFGQIASNAQQEVAQRQDEFMQAQNTFATSNSAAIKKAASAKKKAANTKRKAASAASNHGTKKPTPSAPSNTQNPASKTATASRKASGANKA